MTTTSPSWFASWPTSFPDIGAVYDQTIRRQFGNLYDDVETDEYADVGSIAEVLSLAAQGSMWIRRRLFPQYDTSGLFLDLWEAALGIYTSASATIATRRDRIIRALRYTLGTATKEVAQAIMAAVFGFPTDAARIAFESYGDSKVFSTVGAWARAITSLHVYDGNSEEFTYINDGDCEAVGTADYSVINCTASKVSATPYAGSQSLRLTESSGSGFGGDGYAYQNLVSLGLSTRVLSCAYRVSDASVYCRVGSSSRTTLENSTTWQPIKIEVEPGSTNWSFGASGGGAGAWIEFDEMKLSDPVADVNATSAESSIEQTKGAHETWTVGTHKTLHWDTVGSWDRACWDD